MRTYGSCKTYSDNDIREFIWNDPPHVLPLLPSTFDKVPGNHGKKEDVLLSAVAMKKTDAQVVVPFNRFVDSLCVGSKVNKALLTQAKEIK